MKLLGLAALLGHVFAVPNMNGNYTMNKSPKGRDDVFPLRYDKYPGTVEYFDIYSPVLTSVYSQVMGGALFAGKSWVWRVIEQAVGVFNYRTSCCVGKC